MRIKVRGSRFERPTLDTEGDDLSSGPAVAVPFGWEETPGRAKAEAVEKEKEKAAVLDMQSPPLWKRRTLSLGRSSNGSSSVYGTLHSGSVPFQWETCPGVPKTPPPLLPDHGQPPPLSPPPFLRSPPPPLLLRRPTPLTEKLRRMFRRRFRGGGETTTTTTTRSRFNMVFQVPPEIAGFSPKKKDDNDEEEEQDDDDEQLSRNVSYRSFESFESAFKFWPPSSPSSSSSSASASPAETEYSGERRWRGCIPGCARIRQQHHHHHHHPHHHHHRHRHGRRVGPSTDGDGDVMVVGMYDGNDAYPEEAGLKLMSAQQLLSSTHRFFMACLLPGAGAIPRRGRASRGRQRRPA